MPEYVKWEEFKPLLAGLLHELAFLRAGEIAARHLLSDLSPHVGPHKAEILARYHVYQKEEHSGALAEIAKQLPWLADELDFGRTKPPAAPR